MLPLRLFVVLLLLELWVICDLCALFYAQPVRSLYPMLVAVGCQLLRNSELLKIQVRLWSEGADVKWVLSSLVPDFACLRRNYFSIHVTSLLR